MKLADLDPKLQGTLDDGFVIFDCPFPGHTHRQYVKVHRAPFAKVNGQNTWEARGEFPDTLSLFPSVNADSPSYPCWHGFITNGEVT